MSLTLGKGPWSSGRAGTPLGDPREPGHVHYLEPSPRRVRAVLGEETVADSSDVRLLHRAGALALYLFPRADVAADLADPTRDEKRDDPLLGPATSYTVRAGGQEARAAAWSYEQPSEPAAPAAGLVALQWDAMDAWFEEDEQVFVHPRDPYHRIDVLRTSRRVVVRWGDTVVADSVRARMLIETSLPARWYLPREDVRTELLHPSFTTTQCPYKGVAHYWSLHDGDRREADVVWSYPEPMHDAEAVRDLLCFFDERLSVEVSDR